MAVHFSQNSMARISLDYFVILLSPIELVFG